MLLLLGMSVGVPMAPAVGFGTNIGMNAVPGIGMDPTAVVGLGVTPGLGLNAPAATATVGLGAATAAVAAPPIETECLLVSNMFDPDK